MLPNEPAEAPDAGHLTAARYEADIVRDPPLVADDGSRWATHWVGTRRWYDADGRLVAEVRSPEPGR